MPSESKMDDLRRMVAQRALSRRRKETQVQDHAALMKRQHHGNHMRGGVHGVHGGVLPENQAMMNAQLRARAEWFRQQTAMDMPSASLPSTPAPVAAHVEPTLELMMYINDALETGAVSSSTVQQAQQLAGILARGTTSLTALDDLIRQIDGALNLIAPLLANVGPQPTKTESQLYAIDRALRRAREVAVEGARLAQAAPRARAAVVEGTIRDQQRMPVVQPQVVVNRGQQQAQAVAQAVAEQLGLAPQRPGPQQAARVAPQRRAAVNAEAIARERRAANAAERQQQNRAAAVAERRQAAGAQAAAQEAAARQQAEAQFAQRMAQARAEHRARGLDEVAEEDAQPRRRGFAGAQERVQAEQAAAQAQAEAQRAAQQAQRAAREANAAAVWNQRLDELRAERAARRAQEWDEQDEPPRRRPYEARAAAPAAPAEAAAAVPAQVAAADANAPPPANDNERGLAAAGLPYTREQVRARLEHPQSREALFQALEARGVGYRPRNAATSIAAMLRAVRERLGIE